MVFAALVAFIFLLGLIGRFPDRRTYLAIAVAALVASLWEYLA